MDSDLQAMQLPAFELDCRDWLVATPDDGFVAEEIAGAPVVAMLSTVLVGDDDLFPGTALLSVGLLDGDQAAGAGDTRMARDPRPLEVDAAAGSARYVVPAPDGSLALLAEFSCDHTDPELMDRFDRLMSSFRWAI